MIVNTQEVELSGAGNTRLASMIRRAFAEFGYPDPFTMRWQEPRLGDDGKQLRLFATIHQNGLRDGDEVFVNLKPGEGA